MGDHGQTRRKKSEDDQERIEQYSIVEHSMSTWAEQDLHLDNMKLEMHTGEEMRVRMRRDEKGGDGDAEYYSG